MSESQQESFCSQCHRQQLLSGRGQRNYVKNTDNRSYKVIDLNDAETKFYRLQKQIIELKQENEKKIQTISALKKQLNGSKPRKSSVQIQIQQNKKSFQQLKNTLLTFGNQGSQQQMQKQEAKQENKSSVSAQLIIASLQKRLKQYKIELLKLIEKVQLHQKSTQWMYQFIDSFLKMVIQINKTGRYGQTLVLKQLSIKKRTKIAWRYLKDILEKILNNKSWLNLQDD